MALELSLQTKWTVTSDKQYIGIPLCGGSYFQSDNLSLRVEWGDGKKSVITDTTAAASNPRTLFHVYETPGDYTVIIYGGYGSSDNDRRVAFHKSHPDVSDLTRTTKDNLIKVEKWNKFYIHGQGDFHGCKALQTIPTSGVKFILSVDPSVEIKSEADGTFLCNSTFEDCESFATSIENWGTDLLKCTSMNSMFKNANLSKPWFGKWRTDNVTDMTSMFEGSNFNHVSVSKWGPQSGASRIANVVSMKNMFKDCPFDQHIGWWFRNDPHSIKDMSGMFSGTSEFGKNANKGAKTIFHWRMYNVENVSDMFRDNQFYDYFLGTWFHKNTSSNKSPDGTLKIKNMSGMFAGSVFGQNTARNASKISRWKMGTVEDISEMFKDNQHFDYNLGDWFKSQFAPDGGYVIKNMSGLFAGSSIYGKTFGRGGRAVYRWDMSTVENISDMFNGNQHFDYFLGDWFKKVSNKTYAVTDMSGLFENSVYGETWGRNGRAVANWDMRSVVTISRMFKDNQHFDFNIGNWFKDDALTYAIEDVSSLFENSVFGKIGATTGARKASAIADWQTKTIVNCSKMFKDNTSFKGSYLNNLFHNNKGPHAVKDMSGMFENSAYIRPINNWAGIQPENVSRMFAGTSDFNQELKALFNTTTKSANLKNVSGMFEGNSKFNKDISTWKVDNVEDMSYMFANNSGYNQALNNLLKSEPAGGFKVKNMESMFEGNTKFNNVIGDWKMSSVETTKNMFKNSIFDRWIVNWFRDDDNSKNLQIKDMSGMFAGSSAFGTTDQNKALNNWNTKSVENMSEMFDNNVNFNKFLKGWDTSSLKSWRNIKNKEDWTNTPTLPDGSAASQVETGMDHTVNMDLATEASKTINIKPEGGNLAASELLVTYQQDTSDVPGYVSVSQPANGSVEIVINNVEDTDTTSSVNSSIDLLFTPDYNTIGTNDQSITITIIDANGDNVTGEIIIKIEDTQPTYVKVTTDAPYEGTGDYTTPTGETVDPTDYLSTIVVPGELNDTQEDAVVAVSEPGAIIVGPGGEITIVEPPSATIPPGGTLFTGEFPDSDGTPPPDYKELETITPPTITIGGQDIDLEELLDQPISTEVTVNNSQPPADAEIQISEPGGIVIDEKGNVTIVTPPKAELPAGGTFIPGTPKDTDGDGNPDMETPVPYTFPENITTPVKDVNIELESGNGQDYVVKLWDPTGQTVIDTGNDLAITGVKVGDTIVMNNQTGGHAVRIDAPDGSTVATQPAGQTVFSYTVQSTGVYKYICNVHPNMQGTIEVTQSPVISPSDYLQDAGDGVKNDTGSSVTTEVSPPGGIVLDPETGEVTVVVPPTATIPPGNILIPGTLKDDDGDGEPDVQTPVDITLPGGTITNISGPDVEIDDYVSAPLGKKIKNNSNPPVNTVVNVDNPGGIIVGPNGEVEVVKPPVVTLKPGWTLIEGPLKDEDGDGLPDGFAPATVEYRFANVTVAGGGTKEVLQLRKILPNRTGTVRDTATTWSTVYGFESDAQYGTAQAESAGWFDAGVDTNYDDYHGSSILLNGGAGEIGFLDATHASEPDGYIHLYYTAPGDDTHNWTTGNGVNIPSKLFVYYNDTEVTANGYGIDGAHVVEKADATSNPLEPGPQTGPGTVTGSTSVTKQAGANWDGYVSGTSITFVDNANGATMINSDNGNTGTSGYQVWVGDTGVTETFYPVGIKQNTGTGSATLTWDYSEGSWAWYWASPDTTFRGDQSFTIEWMNDSAWQTFEPYMFGQSISAASADYQAIKAGTSTAEITLRVEDPAADTPGQMTGDVDVSYTAGGNSSNIYDGVLTFTDADGTSDIADNNVGGWYSVGVSSAAGNKGSISLQQNDLSTVGQYKYYAVPGEGDYVDTFTVTWYDNAGNVNQHDIVITVTDSDGGGTGGGGAGTWSYTSPDGMSSSSNDYSYDPAVDGGYINQIWFADTDGITQNAPFVSTQGQYGEAFIDGYNSNTGFVDYSYVSDGSYAPITDNFILNWIDDAGNDNFHTITIEQTSDNGGGGGGGGGSRTFTLDGKTGSVQVTDDPYATPTYDGTITVKSDGAAISDSVYSVEFSSGGTTAYSPNGQFTILSTNGNTITWRYESFYKEAAPYTETASFYWNVDPEGTQSDELSISVTTDSTSGGGGGTGNPGTSGDGGGSDDPYADATITGTATYSVDPWSYSHPTMNNATSVMMDANITYSNSAGGLMFYDVTPLSGAEPQHGVWNSSGQGFGSWIGTYMPNENVESVADEFTLKYTLYYYDDSYNYVYKDVLKTYTINIGSLGTITDTPGVTTGDLNVSMGGYATGQTAKSFNGMLHVEDADGTSYASMSWNVDTPPTHGQVVVNMGSYIYTPNADYVGGDSFVLMWADDLNFENRVTVTINVIDDFSDHPGEVTGDIAGAVYVYDEGTESAADQFYYGQIKIVDQNGFSQDTNMAYWVGEGTGTAPVSQENLSSSIDTSDTNNKTLIINYAVRAPIDGSTGYSVNTIRWTDSKSYEQSQTVAFTVKAKPVTPTVTLQVNYDNGVNEKMVGQFDADGGISSESTVSLRIDSDLAPQNPRVFEDGGLTVIDTDFLHNSTDRFWHTNVMDRDTTSDRAQGSVPGYTGRSLKDLNKAVNKTAGVIYLPVNEFDSTPGIAEVFQWKTYIRQYKFDTSSTPTSGVDVIERPTDQWPDGHWNYADSLWYTLAEGPVTDIIYDEMGSKLWLAYGDGVHVLGIRADGSIIEDSSEDGYFNKWHGQWHHDHGEASIAISPFNGLALAGGAGANGDGDLYRMRRGIQYDDIEGVDVDTGEILEDNHDNMTFISGSSTTNRIDWMKPTTDGTVWVARNVLFLGYYSHWINTTPNQDYIDYLEGIYTYYNNNYGSNYPTEIEAIAGNKRTMGNKIMPNDQNLKDADANATVPHWKQSLWDAYRGSYSYILEPHRHDMFEEMIETDSTYILIPRFNVNNTTWSAQEKLYVWVSFNRGDSWNKKLLPVEWQDIYTGYSSPWGDDQWIDSFTQNGDRVDIVRRRADTSTRSYQVISTNDGGDNWFVDDVLSTKVDSGTGLDASSTERVQLVNTGSNYLAFTRSTGIRTIGLAATNEITDLFNINTNPSGPGKYDIDVAYQSLATGRDISTALEGTARVLFSNYDRDFDGPRFGYKVDTYVDTPGEIEIMNETLLYDDLIKFDSNGVKIVDNNELLAEAVVVFKDTGGVVNIGDNLSVTSSLQHVKIETEALVQVPENKTASYKVTVTSKPGLTTPGTGTITFDWADDLGSANQHTVPLEIVSSPADIPGVMYVNGSIVVQLGLADEVELEFVDPNGGASVVTGSSQYGDVDITQQTDDDGAPIDNKYTLTYTDNGQEVWETPQTITIDWQDGDGNQYQDEISINLANVDSENPGTLSITGNDQVVTIGNTIQGTFECADLDGVRSDSIGISIDHGEFTFTVNTVEDNVVTGTWSYTAPDQYTTVADANGVVLGELRFADAVGDISYADFKVTVVDPATLTDTLVFNVSSNWTNTDTLNLPEHDGTVVYDDVNNTITITGATYYRYFGDYRADAAISATQSKITGIVGLGGTILDWSYSFHGCVNLTTLPQITKSQPAAVQGTDYSFEGMFLGCTSLVDINLSEWDTSKTTSMKAMFKDCTNLTNINTFNWDTSNVTDFSEMFENTGIISVNDVKGLFPNSPTGWNMDKAVTLARMFAGTAVLDVQWIQTNVGAAADFSGMFAGCTELTVFDGTWIDTSNATTFEGMFENCVNLTTVQNTNAWDTTGVTNWDRMFKGCISLKDCSIFDGGETSGATSMVSMFEDTPELNPLPGFSTLDVGNLTPAAMENMLKNSGATAQPSVDIQNWTNTTNEMLPPTNIAGDETNNITWRIPTDQIDWTQFSLAAPDAKFTLGDTVLEASYTANGSSNSSHQLEFDGNIRYRLQDVVSMLAVAHSDNRLVPEIGAMLGALGPVGTGHSDSYTYSKTWSSGSTMDVTHGVFIGCVGIVGPTIQMVENHSGGNMHDEFTAANSNYRDGTWSTAKTHSDMGDYVSGIGDGDQPVYTRDGYTQYRAYGEINNTREGTHSKFTLTDAEPTITFAIERTINDMGRTVYNTANTYKVTLTKPASISGDLTVHLIHPGATAWQSLLAGRWITVGDEIYYYGMANSSTVTKLVSNYGIPNIWATGLQYTGPRASIYSEDDGTLTIDAPYDVYSSIYENWLRPDESRNIPVVTFSKNSNEIKLLGATHNSYANHHDIVPSLLSLDSKKIELTNMLRHQQGVFLDSKPSWLTADASTFVTRYNDYKYSGDSISYNVAGWVNWGYNTDPYGTGIWLGLGTPTRADLETLLNGLSDTDDVDVKLEVRDYKQQFSDVEIANGTVTVAQLRDMLMKRFQTDGSAWSGTSTSYTGFGTNDLDNHGFRWAFGKVGPSATYPSIINGKLTADQVSDMVAGNFDEPSTIPNVWRSSDNLFTKYVQLNNIWAEDLNSLYNSCFCPDVSIKHRGGADIMTLSQYLALNGNVKTKYDIIKQLQTSASVDLSGLTIPQHNKDVASDVQLEIDLEFKRNSSLEQLATYDAITGGDVAANVRYVDITFEQTDDIFIEWNNRSLWPSYNYVLDFDPANTLGLTNEQRYFRKSGYYHNGLNTVPTGIQGMKQFELSNPADAFHKSTPIQGRPDWYETTTGFNMAYAVDVKSDGTETYWMWKGHHYNVSESSGSTALTDLLGAIIPPTLEPRLKNTRRVSNVEATATYTDSNGVTRPITEQIYPLKTLVTYKDTNDSNKIKLYETSTAELTNVTLGETGSTYVGDRPSNHRYYWGDWQLDGNQNESIVIRRLPISGGIVEHRRRAYDLYDNLNDILSSPLDVVFNGTETVRSGLDRVLGTGQWTIEYRERPGWTDNYLTNHGDKIDSQLYSAYVTLPYSHWYDSEGNYQKATVADTIAAINTKYGTSISHDNVGGHTSAGVGPRSGVGEYNSSTGKYDEYTLNWNHVYANLSSAAETDAVADDIHTVTVSNADIQTLKMSIRDVYEAGHWRNSSSEHENWFSYSVFLNSIPVAGTTITMPAETLVSVSNEPAVLTKAAVTPIWVEDTAATALNETYAQQNGFIAPIRAGAAPQATDVTEAWQGSRDWSFAHVAGIRYKYSDNDTTKDRTVRVYFENNTQGDFKTTDYGNYNNYWNPTGAKHYIPQSLTYNGTPYSARSLGEALVSDNFSFVKMFDHSRLGSYWTSGYFDGWFDPAHGWEGIPSTKHTSSDTSNFDGTTDL